MLPDTGKLTQGEVGILYINTVECGRYDIACKRHDTECRRYIKVPSHILLLHYEQWFSVLLVGVRLFAECLHGRDTYFSRFAGLVGYRCSITFTYLKCLMLSYVAMFLCQYCSLASDQII